MGHPGLCWNHFACSGPEPPAGAHRLERLGLLLDGHSRSPALCLSQAEDP
jgi:hypothetical protein